MALEIESNTTFLVCITFFHVQYLALENIFDKGIRQFHSQPDHNNVEILSQLNNIPINSNSKYMDYQLIILKPPVSHWRCWCHREVSVCWWTRPSPECGPSTTLCLPTDATGHLLHGDAPGGRIGYYYNRMMLTCIHTTLNVMLHRRIISLLSIVPVQPSWYLYIYIYMYLALLVSITST